jgi:hypothetical protein
MRPKVFLLAIVFLVLSAWIGSAQGIETGSAGARPQKLQVIPFTYDKSPSAGLVAGQAAYILRRQLRAGRFVLPEIEEHVHEGIPVRWDTRERVYSFFVAQAIDWLVAGHVENIRVDRDAQHLGNRFLGMGGIPIRADITVTLYDCHGGLDAWEQTMVAQTHSPRLKIFGLNRKPFPRTVKSADAFVHDTMLSFSRRILSFIQSFRTETGN